MTPRPQLQDPRLTTEVVARLLPAILWWFGANRQDPEKIQKDLVIGLTQHMDGYRLAEWLEDHRDWDPNGNLVAILNQAPFLRNEIYDQQVKQWVNDNQVHPKLAVGDAVLIRDGKGTEHRGQVRDIDYEEAQYHVLFESLTQHGAGVRALIVPYELVEQV